MVDGWSTVGFNSVGKMFDALIVCIPIKYTLDSGYLLNCIKMLVFQRNNAHFEHPNGKYSRRKSLGFFEKKKTNGSEKYRECTSF